MSDGFFGRTRAALKWIFFVSRRFSRVDRRGKSRMTTYLSSLGICLGVMTLVTVIGVMNGFQRSFVDSIMEVSSYHIRASGFSGGGADFRGDFEDFCRSEKEIVAFTPFYEAQSLVVSTLRGLDSAALIRAVPSTILDGDSGFAREVKMWSGEFDLSGSNSIVIGVDLARSLGVRVGGTVNLFALSGGSDVELFSDERVFTVTGIFRTGYADINASYAFIALDDGAAYFGKDAELFYGVKLRDTGSDARIIAKIESAFPSVVAESWKSYNRSFFGALRVEKDMLMLLVFLIFVVVGINIFNAMRRLVFERREEISVFRAFGAKPRDIHAVFIMQGFLTGVSGAIPGLALGLFLCVRMKSVFWLMSKAVYFFQLFVALALDNGIAPYIRENPMFGIYGSIPTRLFPGEVFLITVFGIFASLLASVWASKSVMKLNVAEVMRDE